MIRPTAVLTAALAMVLATAPLAAATEATPATIHDILKQAEAGTTIHLAPGSYEAIDVRSRHWSPPVIVEAGRAELKGVRLGDVSGLTWHGGEFDGSDTERNGFSIQNSDHIIVDGAEFRRFLRVGIGVGTSSDMQLSRNIFAAMGSDGIDIAMSRRILIDHNRCVDTHPTDGAHPDCVQMWSRPTAPPTADIVIRDNDATGDTQGFTMFNHIRDGVDDGGFDRITIENNHAKVMSAHGVTVYSCRDCIVRHNRVETIPNPQHLNVRTWVKVIDGTNVLNCDNLAESFPRDPGRERCAGEPRKRGND